MKALAIILSLAVTLHSFAQEYSYKQFTTADGLPSNVVYSAYQDNKGYIWFCTNAGVSRFDGIGFKNFTVEKGLSDNEVFGAFQVPGDDKVWFRTFSSKLCYYQNDTFYNPKNQPWLNQRFAATKFAWVDPKTNLIWTRQYFEDSLYSMNVANHTIKNQRVYANGKASIVTANGFYNISLEDEKWLLLQPDAFSKKYGATVENANDVVSYFMFLRRYIHSIWKEHRNIPLEYIYYVFLNLGPPSKFRLHDLIMDRNSGYWLSHGNKGIITGKNLYNLDEKPVTYLPEHNVNNFLLDKEGNYWFTSPTEGVFFLKGHSIRTYEFGNDEEIYSVTGAGDYILCGKEGKIIFINRRSGKTFNWHYTLNNNSAYNRVKDLFIDKSGNCWAASDNGVVNISFKNGVTKKLFPSQDISDNGVSFVASMKALAPSRSGDSILLGTHYSLVSIHKDRSVQMLVPVRTQAVVELQDHKLLLGSIAGLYLYQNGKYHEYLNKYIKEHITDLEISRDGAVWAATNDLGLIILKNDTLYRIMASDSANRLSSNICRKIFIDSAQNIWACTNKGLCLVKLHSLSPFSYSVQRFTADDGLISDDVNDVYVSGDSVWVATSRGLSFFKRQAVKVKGHPPKIYISHADTLMDHSFNFRSRIAIGLEGISFESLGKLRYRYRILGLEDEWQYTDRNQLVYDLLPPGHYELEVYAVSRFGEEGGPAKVSFNVVPPWWRSLWAIFLYVLFFIAALSISFILIRRNLRAKERNRTRLQQLELKALRSQMNPHFIFNMLNAVQKYILENDKEASYRYLTRFSKLIRGFLENSRQTTISLQDELDLLKAYIEMEALRFRNKFTYEIEIDPKLDPATIFIPSMLIQPYVENAIWHGIQHKDSNGFIKLSLENQGANVLKCRIQDNGIGRKKAGEIESVSNSRHQPVGMTITQQRLELINQRLKKAVSVNFIDLAEGSPEGESGTIVELIIAYSTRKI